MQQILDKLGEEIQANYFHQPKLLPGDIYLWVSALQKSIRRGDMKIAASAAYTLLQHDSKRFWNRIHIIACEDVGMASVDVITKVLFASASGKWRREVGELETGLYLTMLLCNAVKTRLTDSVYIQCEKSPAFEQTRNQFAKASDKALADYALDEDNNVVARCLALWMLAGTNKFPSDTLPSRIGRLENAVHVLKNLNTPEPLTEACIAAIKLSRYPLAIFQPLIWQEVHKYPTSIRYNSIPASPDANGLPYYAADGFTRLGLCCFRELSKTIPCLREFTVKQIGLRVFYLNGGLVDKQLSSPHLDAIEYGGELADAQSTGLNEAKYLVLKSCLLENWQELEQIRREHLAGLQ